MSLQGLKAFETFGSWASGIFNRQERVVEPASNTTPIISPALRGPEPAIAALRGGDALRHWRENTPGLPSPRLTSRSGAPMPIPGSIRLISPATDDEWHQADILIAELMEWDIRQSQPLGFSREEVMRVFYTEEPANIRRDSAPPRGCLLLAIDGSVSVGCAAYRQFCSETCELYDLYVRPDDRGRGIGSMLLQGLISNAKDAGYRTMCLETAEFMHDAHELYKSLQFQVREPYRTIPRRLAEATIWMDVKLVTW